MIKHTNIHDLAETHRADHGSFQFRRSDVVPRGTGQSMVSVYELPPLKSAWPYHYHLKNEETFFILKGEGLLKTPEGERKVTAGDFLYFPPDESGAHRLTNTSATEPLVYIDFDIVHEVDVCLYPDSDKIAIWGRDINRTYRFEDNVGYYHGE